MNTIAIIIVSLLVSSSVIYALSNNVKQAIYLILVAIAVKIEMIWNEIVDLLIK